MSWMIYGANGYSAQLIAREATTEGLKPVLAGRNRDKVESIAKELKLQSCVFSLEDVDAAAAAMANITGVIHCAGPFSATSGPMIEACIRSGTHYFDITGEIAVFEHAHSSIINQRAADAGIIICPGIGFDVIPTDCIALTLANAMPDAVELALGFDSSGGVSPGTAKTSLEGIALGSKTRIKGKLVSCSVAHKTRRIDYGQGKKLSMTIPWGDITTAYKTTGIPNINVFIPISPSLVPFIRLSRYLKPLIRVQAVKRTLITQIEKNVTGPSRSARMKNRAWVWGEVKNNSGETRQAFIETPDPYDITTYSPIAIMKSLPKLKRKKGSITPSLLLGANFITELPDTSDIRIL